MRLGRIQNNYTREGFEEVKKQGFPFIEICCNYDSSIEELVAGKDSVKALSKEFGIDVSSVGRWNHEVQKDGKIDGEKAKLYESLLDTAIDLGAKTFVCGCNYDESVSLYKNYTNAISLFGKLLDRADGRIKVAIENCDWNNFVHSPRDWDIVLGELPELWIKYDASHPYNRGEDYIAQLSDYGDRVAHIHIKGTTHAGSRKVSDPPAGMDDIKWPSLFSILYDRGYDGDLSLEPHSSAWNKERFQAGINFTTDYIKKFII